MGILKDSGDRSCYESGAVRDMKEGKGRCDLIPLGTVQGIYRDEILEKIWLFQSMDDIQYLNDAVKLFIADRYGNTETALLEVAKHFEDGAKKYEENNWKKGIPTWSFIDSAIRHYLKYKRGDDDEPHDRAFIWNLICCIWTVTCKPELDIYNKEETGV